jgi:calcineurin-like phosphoesterase family protein
MDKKIHKFNIVGKHQQTCFVSDTHFGHYNIIRHCNRPWNSDEHDEALIQRWNAIVGKRDVVYHLGDFAMFKAVKDGELRMKVYRRTRMRLNGKIHLVLGNHDKMSQDTYNCFTTVSSGIKDIKIDKQKVTLCHYPMRSWNCSFHGAWHFFGHVHSRLEGVDTGLSCDVGVDVPAWNYTPVPWDVLKDKMEKKVEIWRNQ